LCSDMGASLCKILSWPFVSALCTFRFFSLLFSQLQICDGVLVPSLTALARLIGDPGAYPPPVMGTTAAMASPSGPTGGDTSPGAPLVRERERETEIEKSERIWMLKKSCEPRERRGPPNTANRPYIIDHHNTSNLSLPFLPPPPLFLSLFFFCRCRPTRRRFSRSSV